MEPGRLAAHVIGANGDKLNAIMSRARCSIGYRNTQSLEDKDKTEANQMEFSMAFMISADTMKRVEDGALLLQALVESTEEQLRKYQGRGKREEQIQEKKRKRWEKEGRDRLVADGEREEILHEEKVDDDTATTAAFKASPRWR
ncbi:unnamed protein product [Peronospora destructor]|uniref:K Homology domain-containing protein n=1 Tax=Peronospora destructor TaxID=86335 RepID=A0AAV0TCR6_9STRA|nr:unnamed protein product [Peronospora destructor]